MISIVTITYNNYYELIKTLDSIPQSDLMESIVINGGECENTKEFLKTYKVSPFRKKIMELPMALIKG